MNLNLKKLKHGLLIVGVQSHMKDLLKNHKKELKELLINIIKIMIILFIIFYFIKIIKNKI